MYVCICNAVTEKEIQVAINNGANSLEDLKQELQVGNSCGSCKSCAKDMLNKSTLNKPLQVSNISFDQSPFALA